MLVTNFCITTLYPLCPKCIPGHIEKLLKLGQYPMIEAIDKIQSETLQRVEAGIQDMTKNQYKIKELIQTFDASQEQAILRRFE